MQNIKGKGRVKTLNDNKNVEVEEYSQQNSIDEEQQKLLNFGYSTPNFVDDTKIRKSSSTKKEQQPSQQNINQKINSDAIKAEQINQNNLNGNNPFTSNQSPIQQNVDPQFDRQHTSSFNQNEMNLLQDIQDPLNNQQQKIQKASLKKIIEKEDQQKNKQLQQLKTQANDGIDPRKSALNTLRARKINDQQKLEAIKSKNISLKQTKGLYNLNNVIKEVKQKQQKPQEKRNYESPYKIKNVMPTKSSAGQNTLYQFLNEKGSNSKSPSKYQNEQFSQPSLWKDQRVSSPQPRQNKFQEKYLLSQQEKDNNESLYGFFQKPKIQVYQKTNHQQMFQTNGSNQFKTVQNIARRNTQNISPERKFSIPQSYNSPRKSINQEKIQETYEVDTETKKNMFDYQTEDEKKIIKRDEYLKQKSQQEIEIEEAKKQAYLDELSKLKLQKEMKFEPEAQSFSPIADNIPQQELNSPQKSFSPPRMLISDQQINNRALELVVNINLQEKGVQQIKVYEGDTAYELARKFSFDHRISDKQKQYKLLQLLTSKIEEHRQPITIVNKIKVEKKVPLITETPRLNPETKKKVLDIFHDIWYDFDEENGKINMQRYMQIMMHCKQYKKIKDEKSPEKDLFSNKLLEDAFLYEYQHQPKQKKEIEKQISHLSVLCIAHDIFDIYRKQMLEKRDRKKNIEQLRQEVAELKKQHEELQNLE